MTHRYWIFMFRTRYSANLPKNKGEIWSISSIFNEYPRTYTSWENWCNDSTQINYFAKDLKILILVPSFLLSFQILENAHWENPKSKGLTSACAWPSCISWSWSGIHDSRHLLLRPEDELLQSKKGAQRLPTNLLSLAVP